MSSNLFFCFYEILCFSFVIIVILWEFFTPALADGFSLGLSNSKSPQVSRILLCNLANLNNAVVWRVYTRPLISKSSSPFINFWWLNRVHKLQMVSLSFPCFIVLGIFCSRGMSRYFSLFLLSFSFTQGLTGMTNSTIRLVIFFFFIIRSGCMAEIRSYVNIWKSQQSLCVSFSNTDSGLCIYHLFVWSNLNFLHNSLWITFPPSRV